MAIIQPESNTYDDEWSALRHVCLKLIRQCEEEGASKLGDRMIIKRSPNGWCVQIVPIGEDEHCPDCDCEFGDKHLGDR